MQHLPRSRISDFFANLRTSSSHPTSTGSIMNLSTLYFHYTIPYLLHPRIITPQVGNRDSENAYFSHFFVLRLCHSYQLKGSDYYSSNASAGSQNLYETQNRHRLWGFVRGKLTTRFHNAEVLGVTQYFLRHRLQLIVIPY